MSSKAATEPKPRPPRQRIARIAAGLLVAAAGGFLADSAHVPLAFMLGALFACMAGSLAGLPIDVPLKLRTCFMGVIALFLGQSFTPELLDGMARWPITMAMAIAYAPIGGALAFLFYDRVARLDRLTAIFAAAPGGLSAVVMFAGILGGDERRVALSQSLRISIVVVTAPLIAFGLLGYAEPSVESLARAPLEAEDWLWLLLGSAAAFAILRRIGAPIPFLLGPLLASAALRMGGVVEGVLPHGLVEASLVVVGGAIGCRFAGASPRALAALALWTVGGTTILMIASAGFAVIAAWLVPDVGLVAALLAFAPGGVAEMCLIAVALDADPGFVAAHHVARILFILLATPSFAGWLRRLEARRSACAAPSE